MGVRPTARGRADLTAARIWGILRELAVSGLMVLADKAYTGAGEHIRTPYKGKGKPPSQKAANRAHAQPQRTRLRATETWRILRKLRCYLWRAGQLAKAIYVLQAREIAGRKALIEPGRQDGSIGQARSC